MIDPTLLESVLADPSARWAVLTAPGVVLGPWVRTEKASRRETHPYRECSWEDEGVGFCIEITIGRKIGYACQSGCDKPGRGPYCPKCGTIVEHTPSQSWSVTDAPDHFAADAGPYRSREAAEADMDARAAAKGWMLVPEVKP